MTAGRLKRLAQRLRVPLGFVIAPLFLVFAEPTWTSVAAGAAVAGVGLSMRAWASGHLRKMAELTTSGPYAYTRNPLYFGTLLMIAGVSIAGGEWWLVVMAAGAFLAVYVPVMVAEVETMRALFPQSYDEWAAEVPLFVPRLSPARSVSARPGARFDSSLYVRYREYRAALGLVAVLAVLVAKIVFREGL
jgi:protein-S-isoprenylcysteine O-methyltransferase Ste14